MNPELLGTLAGQQLVQVHQLHCMSSQRRRIRLMFPLLRSELSKDFPLLPSVVSSESSPLRLTIAASFGVSLPRVSKGREADIRAIGARGSRFRKFRTGTPQEELECLSSEPTIAFGHVWRPERNYSRLSKPVGDPIHRPDFGFTAAVGDKPRWSSGLQDQLAAISCLSSVNARRDFSDRRLRRVIL
jgi:hypothetical protein